MEQVLVDITQLYVDWRQEKPLRIEKIEQSGSDRIYCRIYGADNCTYIATYNEHVKENETFIYFSQHFGKQLVPVPTVYCVNAATTLYIQEDCGNMSLLQLLEAEGNTPKLYALFASALTALAHMQIKGNEGLDYSQCLTAKEFGKQAIMSDLLYFKYYFLDTLKLPYDKEALLDDFDALSTYLTKTEHKYFMFRDFQSRNIMLRNGAVHFIDYQGGMKGALQYDVASLLWQAKAQLSEEWKNALLLHYLDTIDALLPKKVDRNTFISQYNGYVLIRLLQVLGAYGFRGLFERKAHFLSSIPLALRNLRFFLAHKQVGIVTPEFDRLLSILVSDSMLHRFTPIQATEQSALVIRIQSFSYLKNGLPQDTTNNGGGFVFDMRGILNPGRFSPYKHLSGKDKPVQDFLEQETHMNRFLNSVWDIIDISVEDYLSRNFASLMIGFGCTGGQHRSVYAAEQTARHLRNKYKVTVQLQHNNEANWRTEPDR